MAGELFFLDEIVKVGDTEVATFDITDSGVKVRALYGPTFDEMASTLDIPLIDATGA